MVQPQGRVKLSASGEQFAAMESPGGHKRSAKKDKKEKLTKNKGDKVLAKQDKNDQKRKASKAGEHDSDDAWVWYWDTDSWQKVAEQSKAEAEQGKQEATEDGDMMMTKAEATEFMAKAGYDSTTVKDGAYVANAGWRAATAIAESAAGSSDGGSYGAGQLPVRRRIRAVAAAQRAPAKAVTVHTHWQARQASRRPPLRRPWTAAPQFGNAHSRRSR